ncbi:DUF6456 domain-containing protein [Coralliovum pocilloporae]|uniref:DUF6456 domain-containing protein n=1 Tax=Coralliovum pocilloporae TaxID=3066369 RepID=UPI0033075BCA
MTRSLTRDGVSQLKRLLKSKQASPSKDGFSVKGSRDGLCQEQARMLIEAGAAVISRDGLLVPTKDARKILLQALGDIETENLSAPSPVDVKQGAVRQARPSSMHRNRDESPLGWLYSRKAADGRPMILSHQFEAGERLRRDFERGAMAKSITMDWTAVSCGRIRGGRGGEDLSDMAHRARERVRRALEAAGPDFAGLLLDVCCFLKGLAEVERERRWPPRSAKLVLKLALNSLARHYGLSEEGLGPDRAKLSTWLGKGAKPSL